MLRPASLLLALAACAPQDGAAPDLAFDAAPPPWVFTLAPTGAVPRGSDVPVEATLPAGVPAGLPVYFVAANGGPGPICLPRAYGGACADITGPRVVTRGTVQGTTATGLVETGGLQYGDHVDVQAVVLYRARAYFSNPITIPVRDACGPAGPSGDVSTPLTDVASVCGGWPSTFRFYARAGDPITVELAFTEADGDVSLQLLDEAGAVIASADGPGDGASLSVGAEADGWVTASIVLTAEGDDAQLGATVGVNVQTGPVAGRDFDSDGCDDEDDDTPGFDRGARDGAPDDDADGTPDDCDAVYEHVAGLWTGTIPIPFMTATAWLEVEPDAPVGERFASVSAPALGVSYDILRSSEANGDSFIGIDATTGAIITITRNPGGSLGFSDPARGWSFAATPTSVTGQVDGLWRGVAGGDTLVDLVGGASPGASAGTAWFLALGRACPLTLEAAPGLDLTLRLGGACGDTTAIATWNPATQAISWIAPYGIGALVRQPTYGPIAGAWTGTVVEPTTSYTGTITLQPEAAVNAVAGTSAYSIPCSGNLLRRSDSGLTWNFTEQITAGGGCLPTAWVSVTWDPFLDRLTYVGGYVNGAQYGSATLRRL